MGGNKSDNRFLFKLCALNSYHMKEVPMFIKEDRGSENAQFWHYLMLIRRTHSQ